MRNHSAFLNRACVGIAGLKSRFIKAIGALVQAGRRLRLKALLGHVGEVTTLLSPGEKSRLGLVFAGSMFMALIGVLGVGSIMPFIAVASKPEIVHTNVYLKRVYETFRFGSDTGFLLFLGISVLAFIVFTNLSQVIVTYIKSRFTSMRRHTLSLKLMKGYLGQPYTFFLGRDSFEFVKNINSEIGIVINGTLMQFVDLVSNILQAALLVTFLMLVNPGSTLAILATVIVLYLGIYVSLRRVLDRLGTERFNLNLDRSRIVSEAFWGFKEVKIAGVENVFTDEYSVPSKKLARNETLIDVIGEVPRFLLDTVAFSAIMAFVLLSIIKSGGFRDAAAGITLFAYAGYRLLPAVQGIFRCATKLRYGASAAERIVSEFAVVASSPPIGRKRSSRLRFEKGILVDKVVFTYPETDRPVVDDLSLSIGANSLVGLAGRTGSGKTTIADIILGLLVPQQGRLLIDGVAINDGNRRSWQANLGYVPQNIYLSNDSVAANIAFGVPRSEIDISAVERAARMAQIHDFVAGELKDGYDMEIGERGVRLSGGQRQRIGIARALYRNPPVLVMDEATSALDGHTEQAVMQAIDTLQGTKTIIVIAHRLSTLRKCDVIYHMEKGKVLESGSYDELTSRASYFKIG
jgi:ABC-type bacteriocin/lantibiotic exporter with double-glycine peptidase domain